VSFLLGTNNERDIRDLKVIQKVLYHYTNVDGLKGILRSNRLWLTNISCFKDTHEFIHTVRMLSKKLSLSPMLEQELKSKLIQQNHLIFIGCFCKDADWLSLWKDYGCYNIGFSEQDLRTMVAYQVYMQPITSYSNLLSCEYDNQRQNGIISDAITQWKERGNIISGKEFCLLATLFKRSKYYREQETRLIVQLRDFSMIKTRQTDTKSIKYWELPFRSFDGILPIRSITVGPSQYSEETIRDLRAFLLAHGLEHVIIKQTSISYQELADASRQRCQS